MALALVRSCLMSRVTIGQLRVLQSKPPCLGQGAGFLMTIASNKIRSFSDYPSFYSLNPPVIEEFKHGPHVINLVVGSDELNRTSIWCRMNGTTAQSSIMVSHDNHKDNKVLKVHYVEGQYGIGMEPLAPDKKMTDEESCEMTNEGSWEYDDLSSDGENYYDEAEDREIICYQLLDKSIRLFIPENFYAHVTLMATIETSAARIRVDCYSDLATCGPLGDIRIGRINENSIINPTEDELRTSDINLLYVCTRGKTIMVDLGARETSVNDLAIYLKLAHLEAVKCMDSQVKLTERFDQKS